MDKIRKLLITLTLTCPLVITACKNEPPQDEEEPHVHQMVHHEAVSETCEDNGSLEYWTCPGEEGILYKNAEGTETFSNSEEIVIPASGHILETNYTWLNDQCTAVKQCSDCLKVIETETVTGQFVEDTPVSCSSSQTGHYVANFINADFEQQETTQNSIEGVKATGHLYGNPTYDWDLDKKECTASKECSVCHDIVEETVTCQFVEDTPGTCDEPQKGHLVAQFNNDSFDEQSTTANSVIGSSSSGHAYHKHDAVSSTLTTIGNIEYYSCDLCSKIFVKDGDSYSEITQIQTVDFMPNYFVMGEKLHLNSDYSYEVISGNASVDEQEGTMNFSKPGNISVRISKDDENVTINRPVIDFGNVTGESTDLATVLEIWGFGNKNQDLDVSIARAADVVDEYGQGTAKMDALDYYRPSNTGENNDRLNNMLFMQPSLVSKAVEAGYTHISFYSFIPQIGANIYSTNLGLFSSTSEGMVEGENNALVQSENNGNTWKYQSVQLSALKEGYGIGFAFQAQHLYLSNVRFCGGSINSTVTEPYFTLAKEGKSYDLVSDDLIGKLYTPISNNESLIYQSTGTSYESDIGGGDYIDFVRKEFNQTNIWSPFNGLMISADWIKAAKNANFKGLAVYFKLVSNGDTTEAMNYFTKNSSTGKMGATFNPSGQIQNGFVNLSIVDIADGENLFIGFKGSRLTLSGMTFRTADPGSITWNPLFVINGGNTTIFNS